jgi:mono/diheme cytochrome c family protein
MDTLKINVMKRIVFALLLMPFFASAQTKKTAVKTKATPSAAMQASAARGQEVYGSLCVACHQADGSGVPGLNPPLTKNNWTEGPKNRLIQMVLNGSQGKVEINGETYQNLMPAMAHLTDEQIADVLTYVRNSFGNKASAVTLAEVKTVRVKSKK